MTDWFLPAPVPGNGQESAGSLVTVQTWPGANHITITGPDQRATTVGPPFPVAPFATTDQIGIYQVTQRVRGQDLQGAFVINLFNPEQSRLAPASNLPVVNSTTFTDNGNGVSHQLREIWPWIAAFLLLVLCFEWWLFSRSYQARATQGTEQRRSLGTVRVSTPKKNSLLIQWQDQLQAQYKETRKRVVKATKRTRSKLKRRSTKEEKRVNI
jgi:Ca-activated chloride channel homolog